MLAHMCFKQCAGCQCGQACCNCWPHPSSSGSSTCSSSRSRWSSCCCCCCCCCCCYASGCQQCQTQPAGHPPEHKTEGKCVHSGSVLAAAFAILFINITFEPASLLFSMIEHSSCSMVIDIPLRCHWPYCNSLMHHLHWRAKKLHLGSLTAFCRALAKAVLQQANA